VTLGTVLLMIAAAVLPRLAAWIGASVAARFRRA
jgi:hypothetical protein